MLRYYKRPWDEDRGDEHKDWGSSVWFFEVAEDGFPLRQLEVYQSGICLSYGDSHTDDAFGCLSQVSLCAEDFAPYVISAAEFEEAWISHQAHNR